METSKRLTLTVRCSYAPWQVFGTVAERGDSENVKMAFE